MAYPDVTFPKHGTSSASSMVSIGDVESAGSQTKPPLIEPAGLKSLARDLPSSKFMNGRIVRKVPGPYGDGPFYWRFQQIAKGHILWARVPYDEKKMIHEYKEWLEQQKKRQENPTLRHF
jgi:hypothetical protein